MANEHEILLQPRVSRVLIDNKKLINDLEALAGQYILKLNAKLDSSSPKIKPDIDVKEAMTKLDALAKKAQKSLSQVFGFTDTKGLAEISKLLSDMVSSYNVMNQDAFNTKYTDVINKTIAAVSNLKSEINSLTNEYKECKAFLDHISTSHIKIQPFGDKESFEEQRRSLGIGVASKNRGLELDSWYSETKSLFPGILADADNIEDQWNNLISTARSFREKAKQSSITQDEIYSLFGGRNGIEEAVNEIVYDLFIAKDKIDEAMIKMEPSKFDTSLGYDALMSRAKEIRDSVDKTAEIRMDVVPVTENGETVDKLVKAVITYTDAVGRAATETLAWKESIQEIDGNPIEGVTFSTVNVSYKDNIEKIQKEFDEIANKKQQLTEKLDNLGKGIFSDSDISRLDMIRKKVELIPESLTEYQTAMSNMGADDAKQDIDGLTNSLKELDKEIQSIISKSKTGGVVADSGLNFGSNIKDIQNYIAAIKGLDLNQVQVSEGNRITDPKTGEQIRQTTLAVEESKNVWREYKLSISSVNDEVRLLEGNLVNVSSNLAQKQNVLMARLQSEISNFQADLNTKIDNVKIGDISSSDLSALNDLQKEINSITTNTEDAEQQMRRFNTAFRELSSEIKRGKVVDENSFDINIKSSSEEIKNYIATLKQISPELVQIENSSKIVFGSNAEQIRVVNALISDGTGNFEKYSYSINATTGMTRELDKGLKDTTSTTFNLNAGIKQFVAFLIPSFQAIIGMIKSALTVMRDVDTEMVSIQKVTNRSVEDMKQLAKEAYSVGSEFGRGANEYLKSVAEFSRAGYGETADELGKLALMAENVGEINNELATTFLKTADKSWKLQGNVKELEKVLDGFNNVTNNNATSIEDLSSGIEKSASVFSAAGLDIADFTGIIGTATSVTGMKGSEIANHWKTILMTIRSIKGTTEDVQIIDEAQFNKAGKAIEGLGVSMTYLDGNVQKLRPTMDILNDLAVVWKKLDEAGRNILESKKFL